MLILPSTALSADYTDAPVSPLNAIWVGSPGRTITLPHLGHMFLVCPIAETIIACSGAIADYGRYFWLTRPPDGYPLTIENLSPNSADSRVLVLLLSPDFIADMADFLNILPNFADLLHAVPLFKGDALSRLLQVLTNTLHDREETEDIFLEVVGQLLNLLRLRHQVLVGLFTHKQPTIDDLLPRLLQARQFIEAHYLQPIKIHDVAAYVSLSEYHFARLFKAAFDVTIHQYVLHLRLDEARHLLETSQMRVTDIAMSVEYNSLSAFIHAFRKYFGRTPSEYRDQVRQPQN